MPAAPGKISEHTVVRFHGNFLATRKLGPFVEAIVVKSESGRGNSSGRERSLMGFQIYCLTVEGIFEWGRVWVNPCLKSCT